VRATTTEHQRAARGFRDREHPALAGWAFVAPSVFLLIAFGLIPIVWSVLLSFENNDLLGTSQFIGLGNYRRMASDPAVASAIGHTLTYTLLFVPISVFLALVVAVALNRRIRFVRFYRIAVFIPLITSTIATAIIWSWLLDKDFGLVNYALSLVHIPAQGFFQSPSQALNSIVAMTVWGWLGFDVIIYLAALQGVPQELIEAAQIDGASTWSIFRNITLPLVAPATLFLIVWGTINALQLFDEVYQTTRGGPLGATTVLVYYLFTSAFQNFEAGYAAAVAILVFVGILIITVIQLWIGKKTVYYQS
jgi:multiple sugar transport system permease protein